MFGTKSFVLIMLMGVFLASCAPLAGTPTPPPIPAEEPVIPVTGAAVVQNVEIQIPASQPLQVNALVRGQLPDGGCTTISAVDQVRDGNTFKLAMATTTDPLAICTLAATPFEEIVPLEVSNLPPARYFVQANGIEQSFELLPREVFQFKQVLVDGLNARNYDLLEILMDQSLIIGYWLSEGTVVSPEAAVEQFQLNLLSPSFPIVADHTKNLIELLGTDPVKIVDPEIIEVSPLFTSGWGLQGKDEAILFVAKLPDGSLYWYGILFAKDGFALSNPLPVPTVTNPPPSNQPAPKPEEIPTISILEVTKDETVTIQTHNYPPDTKIYVYMGKIGTQAIDGILVETFNSRKGGTITTTFDIPEKLHGEKQIAIRLESRNGYYSYNWFENAPLALAATDALPTNVQYVVVRQDLSIHSGPAKKYTIIGELEEGDIVRVTGVSVGGKWWRIACPDVTSGSCWVFAKPAFTRPTDSPE